MAEVHPTAALEQFLAGPDGPIFRYLASQAVRVETQAKLNASGIPVEGARNPEGRGPNVRTGRLRASITWAPGRDAQGPFVDIGTPVFYGRILELGFPNGTTYPFLRPAMAVL
jgi:hypothetical protein